MVGDTSCTNIIAQLQKHGWGRMVVTNNITPYPGEPWGFDNGAYGWWQKDEPFEEDTYLRRLERAYSKGVPYLAVLPDIPAQEMRSFDFSMKWLEKLPAWPWYLAVQNGMYPDYVVKVLPKLSGLFLGGDNAFKGTAAMWCKIAHAQGRRFHYGRCGTPEKVRHAKAVGADSLDSAFPLWTRERFRYFVQVINEQEDPQGRLFNVW